MSAGPRRTRVARAAAMVAPVIAVALGAMPVQGASSPPSAAQEDLACRVLSPELVSEVLGIEVADPDPSVRSAATYWSCTYTWEAETMTSMEVAGTTMEVPGENRLSLSISNTEDADASVAYEAGMDALTGSREHEPVDGVGDRALWFPDIPQLSVLAGDHVFHLTVDYEDGERNLEMAKQLVPRILERLE